MDKDHAIKRFVRDKYELLLSKNFTTQKLRQEFHGRYGAKFGRTDPKDFAIPLVRLLKHRDVPPQHIREYLEKLPFFKDLGSGLLVQLREIAYEKDFATGLKEEDLEKIRTLDVIEAANGVDVVKLGIEKSKTLVEIRKKLEEAQHEYDNFPSVLDYEDVPEPDFDPKNEETKQWWERFYLRDNPFPQEDGLSQIDESLYEAVLVRTKPFQDCLGSFKANQKHFFDRGFLLCGDSGFGKTTFVDYLSYHLIQENLLPIRITPDQVYSDSAGFLTDFYLQLRDHLKKEFKKMSDESTDYLAEMKLQAQIQDLVRLITNKYFGVVVFVDDYHKYRNYFEQIFEFLGLLQILKNNLTRARLKAGFIVSGTQTWNARLSTDGHLRGFLDGPTIDMPEITPEMVTELFNRRIKAYCYEESASKINPDFVTLIFNEINWPRAGYRSYLKRIIEELENNNLSIVDTPKEIEQSILNQIKEMIEADEFLKTSFNKLIYGSKFKRYTREQISRCLELLVQTSIHGGINELDKLFDDNKYYFDLLRKSDLIQKRKRKLSEYEDTFDWVIHSRLSKSIEAVRQRFRLGINDYLLKIYAKRDFSSQVASVSRQQSELTPLIKFFDRNDLNIPESALDNIRTALRLFDGILLAGYSTRPTSDEVSRAWDSFSILSDAFFEIDESKRLFDETGISDIKDRWHFHLSDDETLLELLNRHDDYVHQPTEKSRNESLVYKQLREAFPVLAHRMRIIAEDISYKTFFGLSCHLIQHNKAELALFERVRAGYFSSVGSSHYDYIRLVTDYLELKLRKFLYSTATLVFGEQYESQLPPPLRQYAVKNMGSRTNYSSVDNIFTGITRGQLRLIFDNGNNIKKFIGDHLPTGWTTEDWRMFLDQFVIASIHSSHQQNEAYSPVNKELYLNYCRRAEELISSVNFLAGAILKRAVYLLYAGGDRDNPENYFFKYCFDQTRTTSKSRERILDELPAFAKNSLVADHMLSETDYRRVLGNLLYKIQAARRGILVEDLLEVEYLANSYNVSYQDFIHSLAFAYLGHKKVVVQPWFGSSITIKEAVQ